MAQPNTSIPTKKSPRPIRNPNGNVWFWVIMGVVFLLLMAVQDKSSVKTEKELTYSEFYAILKDNPQTHQIKHLELTEGPDNTLKGTYANGLEFKLNIPQRDDDLLKMIKENVTDFSVGPPELFWSQLFFQLIPFLGIFALIKFFPTI